MTISRLRPYRPAFLWAAFLGLLLLTPGGDRPSQFGLVAALATAGGDKIFHALVFAVLGGLLRRAVLAAGHGPLRVLAGGIAYGAVTEAAQAFVPGRSADSLDCLADVLGLLLGWALAALAASRFALRRELPDC
ncbi:MAG: VanZ family protein [Thermoanaerobaculia bacterium]|nr:VanZ family protein [Thermoanaerobaculia bacterium]